MKRDKLVIASSEWEELVGYNTVPDYHACGKPEGDICAKLCSLAETLYKVTFQTRPATCVQGHSPDRGRGREASLRKGVPHFVPSPEGYQDNGRLGP